MRKIIECIPNFSEGRDKRKIAEIVSAIEQTPGVILLDSESDPAHNRSVVTFVGEPEAVLAAAFASAKRASELIDLNKHKGEHPRMGATDVIPFVPIRGATVEECIALAKKLGKKIGDELNIPVYLYEKAATRPERENLADVRRGEYELIKKEIGISQARDPDFGPKMLGPAGATAVGARDPLVAFNVNLKTENLAVAKAIAKKIRFKDGGFKCVKALGFPLEDRKMVQVSMNLTNYKVTPPHVVFDAIKGEAEKNGVAVSESEVIGLIPQEPLLKAAEHYLKIKNFNADQILEFTLQKKMDEKNGSQNGQLADLSLKAFLDEVASKAPVPGGGCVAAMAGSAAAALISMVANLTLSSAKYKEVHGEAKEILEKSENSRLKLMRLIDEDSKAFEKVMAAYKSPQGPNKQNGIQEALFFAAKIPAETAKTALELLNPLERISRIGNANAISDCGVALHMIDAAVMGALLNVKINLKSISNEVRVKELAEICRMVQSALAKKKSKLEKLIQERV